MKHRVAMLIKRHCPDVKLLELYAPYTGKVLDYADMWLVIPAEEPNDIADRVNELAKKSEAWPSQGLGRWFLEAGLFSQKKSRRPKKKKARRR